MEMNINNTFAINSLASTLKNDDVMMLANDIIDDLFKAYSNGSHVESIDIEDLENQLWDDETEEYKEVFQWWFISNYLGEKMKESGNYIVAETYYGYVWGRTGCGYSIEDDLLEVANYIYQNK